MYIEYRIAVITISMYNIHLFNLENIVKLLALALTKLANLVTNFAKQSMANLIINLTKPSLDHDKTWASSRHYNQTDPPTPPPHHHSTLQSWKLEDFSSLTDQNKKRT